MIEGEQVRARPGGDQRAGQEEGRGCARGRGRARKRKGKGGVGQVGRGERTRMWQEGRTRDRLWRVG